MAATQAYTREHIVPRGTEIYERAIKPLVEPEHIGKYLVIDIETGEWDMDADAYAASICAAKKKPGGLRLALRIGHSAAGWFCGRKPSSVI